MAAAPKRRGRPPGSKNKPRAVVASPAAPAVHAQMVTREEAAQLAGHAAREAVAAVLKQLGLSNPPSDAPVAINDRISRAATQMTEARTAEARRPRGGRPTEVPVPVAEPKRRGRAAAAPVAPTPVDDRSSVIRKHGDSLNMFGSQITAPHQTPPPPIRH